MKKNILLLLFLPVFISYEIPGYAQSAVSVLNENFDVACVNGPVGFASAWGHYNPVAGTDPQGAWTCTSVDGNHNTPGMMCTAYYGGAYHLDTAYLLTPLINLSSYTGDVYLHFDSRTTKVYSGSKLAIIVGEDLDSTFSVPAHDTEITGAISPVISEPDSSGWVTHEVDITPLKGLGDIFIAFRYTSNSSSGSIWYLDNVVTTAFPMALGVPVEHRNLLEANVVGIPTNNEVTISYTAPVTGLYHIAMYDMLGKELYSAQSYDGAGTATYTINTPLHAGMFCIKVSNADTYSVLKVMIQ